MTIIAEPAPLSDLPVEMSVDSVDLLAHGFRDYVRYRCTFSAESGPVPQTRDVLRGGKVVGVLAIDVERDQVVLIRQLRVAAQVANGRGDLVEIVAGLVDKDEEPAAAARRECLEEIGVAPDRLVEVLTYLTSPGLADEEMMLYVGAVDASLVPSRAGLADEHEDTRPMCVSIDAALAAFATGAMRSGPLVVALAWLALNRGRLEDLLAPSLTSV